MPASKSMGRLLPLLREYGSLERKRIREGVTPSEYQRWLELEKTLADHISEQQGSQGSERRRHIRVPTRMLAQFKTRNQLKDAVISNVSRGGLFIRGPISAEIGSTFVLCIRVAATGENVDVPCEVVSRNVGDKFTTMEVGVGVKFVNLNAEQRLAVDGLLSAALGHENLEQFWVDE
jgi:Tfp pilus assembly protein PilZ